MKITGVSFGAKNGGSDILCKAALLAAKEAGAEAEFIRLSDWNIEYFTGCSACTLGSVTGEENDCSPEDDFDMFFQKLLDADGVLFVSPVFESGASCLLRTVCERFSLLADRRIAQEGSEERVDPRMIRDKVISFIGVGSRVGAVRVRIDCALCAGSLGWKTIDNDFIPWSNDLVMQDDRIGRAGEIGMNLTHAAVNLDSAAYKGEPGVCPHCHGSSFWLEPGTSRTVCECCGLEGEAVVEAGAWRFVFPPEDEPYARDMPDGRLRRAEEMKEDGERILDLEKDPSFAERMDYYRDAFESAPPPVEAEKESGVAEE